MEKRDSQKIWIKKNDFVEVRIATSAAVNRDFRVFLFEFSHAYTSAVPLAQLLMAHSRDWFLLWPMRRHSCQKLSHYRVCVYTFMHVTRRRNIKGWPFLAFHSNRARQYTSVMPLLLVRPALTCFFKPHTRIYKEP